MHIWARGWGRNMGKKEIAELNLPDLEVSRDQSKAIYSSKPGLFRTVTSVCVAWYQRLHFTGDYRVEVEFSRADILRLFKARFGTELDDWLIDEEGFTVSPDLTKRILRTVKLSDVTLGDLAAMNAESSDEKPATAEKLVESGNVTILRRI